MVYYAGKFGRYPTKVVPPRFHPSRFQPPRPASLPSLPFNFDFRLIERFINTVFPPIISTQNHADHVPSTGLRQPVPSLTSFAEKLVIRTKPSHDLVIFHALFLIARLKKRLPMEHGQSGHRLFITAYMIAHKSIFDDTYSNKSWVITAQGMYNLREINQMEREMCACLDWKINVVPEELRDFTKKVKQVCMPEKSSSGSVFVTSGKTSGRDSLEMLLEHVSCHWPDSGGNSQPQSSKTTVETVKRESPGSKPVLTAERAVPKGKKVHDGSSAYAVPALW